MSDAVIGWLKRLEREIEILKAFDVPNRSPITFDHPLTSASWSGSSHSTTAKTLLDLTTFTNAAGETVPADARMVLIRAAARDSGSAAAASNTCWLVLAPNNTANESVSTVQVQGAPNDFYRESTFPCPCNANREIYYQINATGASTMDIILQIWGYFR